MIHRLAWFICTASVLSLTTAQAQQGEGDATAGQLEEITVTAQRTTERLQDTPLSVSAFTAESIDRLQINSATDISRLTPNVKFDAVSGGSTGLKPYIRGGGVADGGIITSESEVGFYVDEVYRARLSAALVDFLELSRIEVLRGPQGVLYGRNSSAGAVNFITRAPTDTFSGTAQIGYGSWNERRLKGFISAPLNSAGDWLASFNGMVRARDGGRQYNTTLREDVGEEKFQGGQADLAYRGDDLNARLSVFYTNADTDGQYAVNHTQDANGRFVPRTGSYRVVASPVESFTKAEQSGATLNLSADYSGGTLTSITGYSELDEGWRQDFSGGVPASALFIPGGGMLALFDRTTAGKQHQFSQELRAAGKLFDDKLDYLAGLYYFTESANQLLSDVIFFGPSTTRFVTDTTSYAAFGQATWNVTDTLALVAGGRYTKDEKQLNAALSGNALPQVKNKWSKFTPKVGANYKWTPDVLLYATYSEGFKSGGYNGLGQSPIAITTPFQPQTTQAYEAGIKADLFAKTLRVNVAAFKNKVKDLQNTLTTVSFGFVVENYNANLEGLEIETTWRATEQLTLWMNGSLNHGKYVSGGTSVGINGSIINNELPVFPDYAYSIGVDFTLPVGEGSLKLGSDYGGRDEYFATADNAPIGFVERQQLLNAYIGYEQGAWSYQVAGKNLLQEEGWNTGFGFSVIQPRFSIDPRTVLATARYSF